MLAIIFFLSQSFAAQTIFHFYDDGGEHGYLEKCGKFTEGDELYKSAKSKLKGSTAKDGFLGKVSSTGELGTHTDYFYSDEKKCNEHLKKARVWFDKSNKTKPSSFEVGDLLTKDAHTLKKIDYFFEFYGPAEFCNYSGISIVRDFVRVLDLKELCGRETKEKGSHVLSDGQFTQLLKLGPKESDIYLYILEEAGNYNFVTKLMELGSKPVVIQTINDQGKFADFNGDGLLDLLKAGGKGEPIGLTSSYDPYLVYRHTKGKPRFTLDEKLSKKYSEENKYEWHGAKPSAAIQVDKFGKKLKAE